MCLNCLNVYMFYFICVIFEFLYYDKRKRYFGLRKICRWKIQGVAEKNGFDYKKNIARRDFDCQNVYLYLTFVCHFSQ